MVRKYNYVLCGLATLVAVWGSPSQAQEKPGRGAIPPADLQKLVTRQTEVLKVQNVLLKSAPRVPVQMPACAPNMPRFDWRQHGKVAGVQQQGSCGSCWAFAAIAAYESSHLIQNNLKYTATAVNPSEQQALDCSYAGYSCDGGWHDKVFDYLTAPGETSRDKYPYQNAKQQCKEVSPLTYRAVKWGYVKGDTIPTNAELKKALCEKGPLVAAVLAEGWDDRLAAPHATIFKYSTKNPNWKTDFKNGLFRGTQSKTNLSMDTLQAGDVDHDVLIIGWDEQGWVIRNSWGTEWGDAGYIKLAYNNNNIGFNAAWIQAAQVGAAFPESLKDALQSVSKNFKVDVAPAAPPPLGR